MRLQPMSEVRPKSAPKCPTCASAMRYHGDTFGYVCCGWLLLFRQGGWERDGKIVRDRRLAHG